MFKINDLIAAKLYFLAFFCINSFGYASADLEVQENKGTYTCTLPLKWVQEAKYKVVYQGVPTEFTELGEGEYSIPFSYTPADNENFSFVIPTGFPMAASLAIYDLLQGNNIEKYSKNLMFGVVKGDTINLITREKLGTYKKELVDTPLQISQKLGYVYHLLKTTAEKDTQVSKAKEPTLVSEIIGPDKDQTQLSFVKKSFEKLSGTISRSNSMNLSDIRKLFSELKDFYVTEYDQRGAVLMITGPSGKNYTVNEHPRKNASNKVRKRHYTEQVSKILKKENVELK